MGVTVQLMVDASVSGVMFTCNPVSGDPSMVAINASWGLGLAVVGGEVTPDDYLVSKVTGEVVAEHVHDKAVEYVPTRPVAAPCASTCLLSAPRRRPSIRRAAAALLELARDGYSAISARTRTSSGRSTRTASCSCCSRARSRRSASPRRQPAPADALSMVMKTFGAQR